MSGEFRRAASTQIAFPIVSPFIVWCDGYKRVSWGTSLTSIHISAATYWCTGLLNCIAYFNIAQLFFIAPSILTTRIEGLGTSTYSTIVCFKKRGKPSFPGLCLAFIIVWMRPKVHVLASSSPVENCLQKLYRSKWTTAPRRQSWWNCQTPGWLLPVSG